MAFIYFSTDPKSEIVPNNIFENNPFDGEELPSGDYCVEYDYDKTAEELDSLTLNSDKTAVVNRFPGKTLEEQKVLLREEAIQNRIEIRRKDKRNNIKTYVKEVLEEIGWRQERAEELDELEGAGVKTRQAKVAAYRQAARDANNAHELLLNPLTTEAEIEAFDADWRPAFYAANPIDF
jgi:hypothetical protein